MQNLPHNYSVAAVARCEGNVEITSPGLERIDSAPPAEFGGPGDVWSPETFLVAAVADCFVLTFRAIARASKLEWVSLRCDADGILDRDEQVTRFTDFRLRTVLEVPEGCDIQKATRILEKAEQSCLITNSLSSVTHLEADVQIAR